jgi:hypothetical protein
MIDFSQYPKLELIRTPLPMLQIISAGGVRFSTLIELWGSNKAGKSTTCYQTAGYFLNDFGDNARVKILDSETSVDYIRLIEFGLDTINDPRIEIKQAVFIEDGMFKIFKWIDGMQENERLMIIWDTIAASPSRSSYESADDASSVADMKMFSGGMIDRPKVIKHYLRQAMSKIYGKKVTIWLPNQVFTSPNQYGAASIISGEGNALKHDLHYSLFFYRSEKEVTHDDTNLVSFTQSSYKLTKSKFCPEFKATPLFLNNTLGGLIDERRSLFEHCKDVGYIIQSGGYFKLQEEDKNQRWDSLVNSNVAYKFLLNKLVTSVRRSFPTIDRAYLIQGYPPLETTEEKKKPTESTLNFDDCLKMTLSGSLTNDEETRVEDLEKKIENLEKEQKIQKKLSLKEKKGVTN